MLNLYFTDKEIYLLLAVINHLHQKSINDKRFSEAKTYSRIRDKIIKHKEVKKSNKKKYNKKYKEKIKIYNQGYYKKKKLEKIIFLFLILEKEVN